MTIKFKDTLIFFIISIVFFVSLALSFMYESAWVLFLAFYLGGALVASFIYLVFKKEWKFKSNFIFVIVGAILSILVSFIIQTPLLKNTNRLYYKQNIVHFNELIKKPSKHRYIFAFDNSGAYINDNISEEAKIQYEKYKGVIGDYTNSINNYLNKKSTYKNLLKSRLCFDLITTIEDSNAEFRILKIGNPLSPYPIYDYWLPVNKKNIIETLQKIYIPEKSNDEECYTDFCTFYERINDITNESCKYTLFIYSDFVHDKNNSKTLQNDFWQIKKLQDNLNYKDIIQNLFIAPIVLPLKKVEKRILPDSSSCVFHFKIDFDEQTNVPYVIERTNNLVFFYSDDLNNISTSLQLEFEKVGNYIRIIKKDNRFSIFDGDEKYIYQQGVPLKKKIVTIKYEGNNRPKEEEEPQIEIIQNGTNYLVPLRFERDYESILGLIISLFSGVIGFSGRGALNWVKGKK